MPESGPHFAQIRAGGDTYLKGVLFRLAMFGPLIVIGIMRPGMGEVPPGVWWTIIGLAVAIGVLAIAWMIVEVTVDPDGLRVRRLCGVVSFVSSNAMSQVVFVRHYASFGNNAAPMVAVLTANGRPVVKLSGHVYSVEALQRFASAMRPRTNTIDEPIAPNDLAGRYPRLVPFWERKPMTFGFGVTAVIIVVIVVEYAMAGEFS